MDFGWLPPEINSGRMYAGAGAGPMLAAASAWDGLAAELHSTAAGYNSVIAGLTSDGWMGPASTSMAAAAAPYAAWMSATAAQAEQAGAQARAAVAGYEAAFAATVPPPVVAANRAQLAALVATNILGQNTPAIAATEAHYAEMWAQDSTAMYGYAGTSANASALTPFTSPKQTTNPAGMSGQAAAVAQVAGNSAGTHAQAVTSTMPPMSAVPQTLQNLASTGSSSSPASDLPTIQQAASWATMLPQNGSYLLSLGNSLNSLMRAGGAGAAAAAGANALSPALTSAVGSGSAGLSGLSGFGGAGSALTAGLGQSGTIGALSVPQAWAAASPATGSIGSALGGTALGATPGVGANPGSLLHGMPMLANAAARTAGGQTGVMPRFDLRPSVIPLSPAAG